eukprot:15247712-Ditylum_brightwellii.AAC.1
MGAEDGTIKTLVALIQANPNSSRKRRDNKGLTMIYCPVGRKCCDYHCHHINAYLPLIPHCID